MAGVFLGIGMGPIQTGIFFDGAEAAGFDRICAAEVNKELITAVRENRGQITINIAGKDAIKQKVISNIEILNPLVPDDLEKLVNIAADADEISTALPSAADYSKISWLSKAFKKKPGKKRLVFTSENDNYAAEKLKNRLALDLKNTEILNTVIGKMSSAPAPSAYNSATLSPLVPGLDLAHLAEEFNNILISSPRYTESRLSCLHPKKNLLPFEEAKLFGHNAVHFLIGLLAREKGISSMAQVRDNKGIMNYARSAFIEESGKTLIKKCGGADEFFTSAGFTAYADDLLERMTSRFLCDPVERVCRDMERKLGWNDRVIGLIRTALSGGIIPYKFIAAAALGLARLYSGKTTVENDVKKIWGEWSEEQKNIWQIIFSTSFILM